MDQQLIRQQAETLAQVSSADESYFIDGQQPEQNLQEVLHELRVHQIELEMQNEELRRVQSSLAHARKEYFDLYNFAPVAYLTLDRRGLIQNINLRGAELLARVQRYLINRPLLLYVSPQYHTHLVEYLDEVFESCVRMQTEVVLANSGLHVTLDAVAALTEQQEPICRMVMMDITMLRQIEQSLRVEKEQLHVMLYSIADGVLATNADGLITLANPPALAMLEMTEAAVRGQSLLTVLSIFDEKSDEALSPLLLQSMKRESVTVPQTALLRTTGGSQRWIALSASPLRDGELLLGMIVVFRDETTKRQQQVEELRTQKLEALGTLAGGIAHDFNNLLAGFFGKVDIARHSLSPEHRAYRAFDSIMQSLERATHLTSQLLTFAQGGEPVKEPLSLAEVITEVAHFSLHGSNVKLQINIAQDLYAVVADRGQLGQVISNLVINAQQAMPLGGTVTICARNCEQSTCERSHGSFVEIAVHDEGVGIAPNHLARIFDPYFTTKQKGSGLGLTTTHSIIQKHGGTIVVDSKRNVGTTFIITLPALADAPPVTPQLTTDSVTCPTGPAAQVLILDDEAVVRDALGEAIEQLGHHVTFAVDGNEAVATYLRAYQAGSPYDLVITDLTIPGGIGGQAATQEILRINPNAKIIVSSGYATDPVMANYDQYGFVARLVKPYRLSDLQAILQQVLGTER